MMSTISIENAGVDEALSLALAVIRNRMGHLCDADRSEVYSLIPDLLSGDSESRQSAEEAVREILHAPASHLGRIEDVEGTDDDLTPWMQWISHRIREARDSAGLTQVELAERSGLPQSHLSRLEQAKHSPTGKTLEKIASALGLDMSHFDRPN